MKKFKEWIDEKNKLSFGKWFGNSKVIDEKGNPKVVYHGTSDVFNKFDSEASSGLGGYERKGMFFTSDSDNASGYANQRQKLEFKKIIAKLNKSKEEHDDYVYELSVKTKSHAPKSYSGEIIPRMMTSWINDLHNQKKITDEELKKYYDLSEKLLEDNDKYEEENRSRWDKATPNVMPVYLKIERPLIVGDKNRSINWDAIVPPNLESFDSSKYDGIIFQNIIDNGDESLAPSDVYVVFKPEQIKSAIGNKGSYNADSSNILD